MEKRKLRNLNLIDNFLFGSVVAYPGIGEEFSRRLLEIISQRDFEKLKVIPQKVYYGSDTHLHGARLDVYLEELTEEQENRRQEEQTTIYDVEPDKNGAAADVASLPRRVRFYHAKMDSYSLMAGESYESLKNVMIIMIVPYDPFGLDRMVYTIKNSCKEEPQMSYEDGACTLFLYTRGTKGNPPKELRELLHYMEHTTEGNAKNADLQELHRMVEKVKLDAEVTIAYMRLMEDENILLARGRQEGRQEGIQQGAEEKTRSIVENMLKRGMTDEDICTLVECEREFVGRVRQSVECKENS